LAFIRSFRPASPTIFLSLAEIPANLAFPKKMWILILPRKADRGPDGQIPCPNAYNTTIKNVM
jgi:hypothetical protein